MENVELFKLYEKILIVEGYLSEPGKFTSKADKALNYDSHIKADQVVKFRELFPKGILPNGKPARSDMKEVTKKLIWFFDNYKYDWDIVYTATKMYIEHFEQQHYQFMQTAGYFISKQDTNRNTRSALAEWCDRVVSGDTNETQTFDINI